MLNNPQRNLNFGVVKSAGDDSWINVFESSTPADQLNKREVYK